MEIKIFSRIRILFNKYERHISSTSLILGFVVDNLTLQRIDLLFENIVLFSYLFISLISIIIFNLHRSSIIEGKVLDKLSPFIPVVIQFVFGGLFSGFIVFYTRSASLLTSWPFLLILFTILIMGELSREFYRKFSYQLIVFFIALFSFSIFYVPVLTKKMNEWIFILSGIISVTLIYLLIRLFIIFIPKLVYENLKIIMWGTGSFFILINIFYFSNILPPIPLSLKDGGIYHSVIRTQNGYVLRGEERKLLDLFRLYKPIHVFPGNPIYAFSSVFAPTDLNTEIVHEWQYYDKKEDAWVTISTIKFPIVGGSDGGYRGYSFKENLFPGKWRVNVNNTRNQVIGRLKFRVTQGRPLNMEDKVY